MTSRTHAFDRLLTQVLDLVPTDPDTFSATEVTRGFDRVYGGQMLAQALLAASRTVPEGRLPQMLHATYLRMGRVDDPLRYEVERLSDSGHFSNRLTRVRQGDRLLACVQQSFGAPGEGLEHQVDAAPVPDPTGLASRDELAAWPIEFRYADRSPWSWPDQDAFHNSVWWRAGGAVPDDPTLHACVLAFACDLTMVEPMVYPHGYTWETFIENPAIFGASLNQSIWFHRPIRSDGWILHVQECHVAAESRGLTSGRMYAQSGQLVASTAQEMLVRP